MRIWKQEAQIGCLFSFSKYSALAKSLEHKARWDGKNYWSGQYHIFRRTEWGIRDASWDSLNAFAFSQPKACDVFMGLIHICLHIKMRQVDKYSRYFFLQMRQSGRVQQNLIFLLHVSFLFRVCWYTRISFPWGASKRSLWKASGHVGMW